MPSPDAWSRAKRNDPCPCGSGKKFKKCCIDKVKPKTGGQAGASASGSMRRRPSQGVQQAMALHHAGRLQEAAGAYRQILARQPNESAALGGLAQIAAVHGNFEQAADLMTRAVNVDRNNLRLRLVLAELLFHSSRANEGLEHAQYVLTRQPSDASAACLVATCLEVLRRYKEGIAVLEEASRLSGDHALTSIILARLYRREKRLDDARSTLDVVLERSNLTPVERQRAENERGVVLDRCREFDAAFTAFEACGRATRMSPEAKNVDPSVSVTMIEQYRAGLTSEWIDTHQSKAATPGNTPRTPAFLVGFPRSGTTMTEQIMAAHPGITTLEERPIMRAVIGMARQRTGTKDCGEVLAGLNDVLLDELRDCYWKRAEAFLPEDHDGAVVVDKLPLNLIDLPLIYALFPDAPVLVALRDPRDVCLSCLMQDFRINDDMANFLSLDSTVAFYTKVMAFWLEMREAIPLKWIEVRYEDTVADLESQARRILEHLGVAWDPAVLQFHEQARERLIQTPSFEAVSEPIHSRAVGRWHGYRTQFEPHLAALAPFAEAFGYEVETSGDAP